MVTSQSDIFLFIFHLSYTLKVVAMRINHSLINLCIHSFIHSLDMVVSASYIYLHLDTNDYCIKLVYNFDHNTFMYAIVGYLGRGVGG